MVGRFAQCFRDLRRPELIEHEVKTPVGQRVFGIAPGYEDLNDHDDLRHDPVMAVLAGELSACRKDCAPVAGKSTLNRLELSRREATRYHKISYEAEGIEALFVALFLESLEAPPAEIILDLDATDDPLLTEQDGDGRKLYETIYCARGEMENRIKECQTDLFADRTSTATMRANQLRLWFASMAYVLVESIRRLALQTTDLANASCGSNRRKLFKIGALVTISIRRVKLAMASGCPYKSAFAAVHRALSIAADTG